MFTRIISKLFKKKLYKAEVVITNDEFIAEYHSDSLAECLNWTLVGLKESRHTSNYTKSASLTNGVYGRIMPFKVFNISKNSVGILSYKRPITEDYLFMTDKLVHIPESIIKKIGKEEPNILTRL